MPSLPARTQRAVDALMAWLHWHDIPKSQAFYFSGMLQALSLWASTVLSFSGVPVWGRVLLGGLGFLFAVAIMVITMNHRDIDRHAEECNALTRRDEPEAPFVLATFGVIALMWIVFAVDDPTELGFTIYFALCWLRSKAQASPRYPKPPAKRALVPVAA